MSRRASVFARQNPGRRRVRFPDEVVFEESIKESDGEVIMRMLRRASVDIDVDRINMAGMTALHQAVLDNNLVVVRILIHHGAQIDKSDVDSWTPLHAAAANGHHKIAKYLISQGADKNALTDEGERPIDLVDPTDKETMETLLEVEDKGERDRRLSLAIEHGEPAWFRRESIREDLRRESFNIIRARKGSMWNSNSVDEEEEDEDEDDVSSSDEPPSSPAKKDVRSPLVSTEVRKLATSMNRCQVLSSLGTMDKPVTSAAARYQQRLELGGASRRLQLRTPEASSQSSADKRTVKLSIDRCDPSAVGQSAHLFNLKKQSLQNKARPSLEERGHNKPFTQSLLANKLDKQSDHNQERQSKLSANLSHEQKKSFQISPPEIRLHKNESVFPREKRVNEFGGAEQSEKTSRHNVLSKLTEKQSRQSSPVSVLEKQSRQSAPVSVLEKQSRQSAPFSVFEKPSRQNISVSVLEKQPRQSSPSSYSEKQSRQSATVSISEKLLRPSNPVSLAEKQSRQSGPVSLSEKQLRPTVTRFNKAPEESKHLEDDVENLLENWRKKRIEKRER